MANADTKSARIETRVSAEQKAMIERAAAYAGRTVSEFVLGNVEKAAKAVIDEHEKVKLDREQSQALVEFLLAPASPNKKLRTAARDHGKRVTSR